MKQRPKDLLDRCTEGIDVGSMAKKATPEEVALTLGLYVKRWWCWANAGLGAIRWLDVSLVNAVDTCPGNIVRP